MKHFYPILSQSQPGFRIGNVAIHIAVCFLFTMLLSTSAFAADRYSVASGPWSSTATWSASSGGGSGASAPVAGDNVIIEGGRTVSVDVASSAANVSIAFGSILNSTTLTLTVSGDFTNAGTYTVTSGILNIGGILSNTGTFTTGSGTVNFNGTTNQTIPAINYFNLSSTNNDRTLQSSGIIGIGGAFTPGMGIYTVLGSTVNFRGAGQTIPAFTFENLQTATSGTKMITGAVTVNNVLTIGAGTTLALSTFTLTLSGVGTPLVATGALTANTSTVIFNASGNQTIPALIYNNLQTAGSGIKSLGGTVQVNNVLTVGLSTTLELGSQILNLTTTTAINPLVLNGGFSAATSTVNYNGVNGTIIASANYFNLSSSNNTRTFQSSGTIGIAGIFTPGNQAYTAAGSTVNFNGAGNQTIPALATITYNNLQTSTSGIKSLGGAITVSGVLTVGTSTTLELGAQTLTLSGSGTPLVVAGTFSASSSTVNYTNAGSTNVTALNYFNLNLSNGTRVLANAGTIGIAGAFTPGTGPFTITGSTVNFNGANGQTIPAFNYFDLFSTNNNRVLANGGTIGIANTFSPGTGTYTTINNTVSFNGNGNQTIPVFTYNNLQTATAGTKTLAGAVTVNAVLTVGASTTLELGAQTLNLSGGATPLSVIATGNFSASTSTVNYGGGAGTIITGVNYYNLVSTNNNTRTLQNGGTIGIANIFTPGTGAYTTTNSTVVFNGAAGAQSFAPTFTFNNLTINNASDVTIGANVTVNTGLTFTNGKLNTGSNTLILGSTTVAGTVTGAGPGKYVNGNFRKGIPTTTTSRTFEVGDANAYAPVNISFSTAVTTAGTITVNTVGTDHPQVNSSEINPALTANRFWTISNAGVAGFTSYSTTFNYVAADLDAGTTPLSFVVNGFTPSTWATPTSVAVSATSTQATGLTTFGDFQVGEAAAAIAACGFNANTNSGINIIPCITNTALVNGSDSIVSNTFSANQYFTLDVIKGMVYQVYTSNVTNPASPLTISVYDEAFPANAPIAFSASNAGNGVTGANNVFVSFTSPISGRLRVLINKRRDCASTLPNALSVRARVVGGANTEDNQLTAGNDSWVGHIYDGTNASTLFTNPFTNYLGYYNQTETFNETFGGNNDVTCNALVNSAGSLRTSFKNIDFSIRYRMNSTRRGLHIADIGSDDGTRLAVDGSLVYNDWVGQGYTPNNRVLMSLTGTSNLQLDFYEGSSGNQVSFLNFTQVLANQLSTNTNQNICQGSPVATISGDVFGSVPTGLTLPAYQWTYSTTPGGTRTAITGATSATFTASTLVAPFNVPGTYYVYRNARLSSANNLFNPSTSIVISNESNAATLVVTESAPIQTVTAASTTFCYGNSTNINLSSSTVGVSYQLRNNAGNAAIGAPVAGTGGAIALPTGPLFATTTFNVLATNSSTFCTISMTGTPTVATTPNGGKAVSALPAVVCVGNSAQVIVSNTDLNVKYLLRNDADNSVLGDSVLGNGGDVVFNIPIGYLLDPATTFNVIARDINADCVGQLVNKVTINTQNFPSPIFSIEQDFCTLGQGKVILATTDSSFNDFLWSNGDPTPSIVIEQSGFYSITVTDANGCRTTKSINIGDEKVINGDFSQGVGVGYTTGYILNQAANGLVSPGIGYYAINSNANFTHSNFWGRDHTSKTGNFMIINGDGPARTIWQTTVDVLPNTRYYFSAWGMSTNNVGPFGQLQFNINGVNSGTSPVLAAGVNNNSNSGWSRFFGTWDSEAVSGTITIRIVNLQGASGGNDFAIDDISFSTLPPVTFFGASVGNGGNNLCLNDTLKLTATLTGGANPITYSWTGPGGFTSSLEDPIVLNADGGWYYLTAIEGRNCQSMDSIFIIKSDPNIASISQPGRCQDQVRITLSGMVPNSINNTIYYNVNNGAQRTAVNVNSDAFGNATFTPNPALVAGNTGQILRVTGIFNGSCTKNFAPALQVTLDIRNAAAGWIGITTGNWNDPANWCPGVPGTGTDVTIPTGVTVYVNDNETANARNLNLVGTARLELRNSANFNFYGVFSGTGKIDARKGIVATRRNNAIQDMSGDYFVEKSVSTLLLANTGGTSNVTIVGDSLKILSALEFGNTAADLVTNNKIVLASSDTATARVGILNIGNAITGNFIVERYLRLGAKWRLLSAPTNRAGQTVRNSWQENGALGSTVPGYGVMAVDPRYTPANTLGFDGKGTNNSVKKWNLGTQSFVTVDSTTAAMSNEQGYMIFVQSDRSVSFPSINATRLRTVGAINTGTRPTIPVPANQFVVVGNPYPSRIDIRNISRPNVDTAIYVWDPSLGGAYGLGQFNTLFKDGSNYRNTLPSAIYGPAFSINNYIESGMAFMVRGSAVAGSVIFEENDKAVGSILAEFAPNEPQRLRANLNLAPQGSKPAILLDGAVADFNGDYSNQADDHDIKKIGYTGETAGWKTSDASLVIDRRFTPADNDTLHLQMGLMRVQNYQWELGLDNMDYPGMNAYLLDRYKGSMTPLSMTGTTLVNFNVVNIPGSYAADRFKIIFKQAGVLPVTITSISASRNNQKTVAVQWKVDNELNMQGYEVERSVDGNNFVAINTQAPHNNTGGRFTYSSIDNNGLPGDLFYRIKANSLSGQVQYSAIVKVSGIKINPDITVYPNPVTGKQVNIRFSGMETGNYTLVLLSAAGQTVYRGTLAINAAVITESIQLNTSIAGGRYQLIITSPAGVKTNKQVIIQ